MTNFEFYLVFYLESEWGKIGNINLFDPFKKNGIET